MQALFLTSQRLITEHWPAAARLLAPVLRATRGEFTVDDLEELCRDGRAVAGVVSKDGEPVLALVFEWRFFPRKTVLNVIALAGRDLDAIAATFWPDFKAWAKESGATEIEACCSPAMTRLLAPLGFAHTYDTLRTPCH
jgi:hypothetical protein